MKSFKEKVIEIVNDIPSGRVVSYGQVATYAAAPRAARQVGWVLNQLEGHIWVPWWRVVNNAGRISIKGTTFYTPLLMKELLEKEGVDVHDDLTFDMETYRFAAPVELLYKWGLDDRYIDVIRPEYLSL
jgi:methylated-DNA-protein-cysteine methyltransferase-like protein